MFTGLIGDIGEVLEVGEAVSGDKTLRIKRNNSNVDSKTVDLKIGDSVACDGCCLTVTEIDGDNFIVEISAESLANTTCGKWHKGYLVNLETSLLVGDALGGHFVLGHVDMIAEIATIKEVKGSKEWWLKLMNDESKSVMRFIAKKGSITINGVSLTVNELDDDGFSVNIISHTNAKTNFQHKQIGDKVNLEIDVIARYTEQLMSKTTHVKNN